MKLTPIKINPHDYPAELQPILANAKLYDSSCSPEAKVIFVDKHAGYFLKSAPKGTLEREVAMTRYFHSKGLSANVLAYVSSDSDNRDWLLTEKIHGDDCTADKYCENPKRLCDTLAERLALLHSLDFTDCPVPNHTELYISKVNYDNYEKNLFPETAWLSSTGSKAEAQAIVEKSGHLLQTDTLLHGDYCLPNVILDDWRFSGFIDLDCGGVGDRHVDVYWGAWTLFYNLKTDKYRERFIHAYGRDKVDEEMFRVIAAFEVFG